MLDAFRGWRTVLFNALALVVLVAQENGFVLDEFDDGVKGYVPFAVLVANLLLRFATKTPVFSGRSID